MAEAFPCCILNIVGSSPIYLPCIPYEYILFGDCPVNYEYSKMAAAAKVWPYYGKFDRLNIWLTNPHLNPNIPKNIYAANLPYVWTARGSER
jgi:hypothetical protein